MADVRTRIGAARTASFLVLVLALLLTGCGIGPRFTGISSIRLACVNLCKKMNPPPFAEKTFDEKQPDALRAFQKAMRKADKMRGSLDYDALFRMQVSYKNGSVRNFTLNVEEEPGWNGLIVDQAHSEVGYRIPKAEAEALRKVIYGK